MNGTPGAQSVDRIKLLAVILVLAGMSVSYTNSMLVSIQRRFGFSTTQIGLILAMTEVGHICAALLVAHLVSTSVKVQIPLQNDVTSADLERK